MRLPEPFRLATAIALAVPLAFIAPALAPAAATPAVAATTDAPITPFPEGVTRLSGASRYETAVAVSQRYAPGVPAVFIATGADFPDALSAAAAAALVGGPLLLTTPDRLPGAVSTELQRLKPAHIYIVGGTGVVSSAVEKTLSDLAPTSRLAGADRYSTGRAVVAAVFGSVDHAIIATGRLFPDALAATGAAGARRAPVVLVDGTRSTVGSADLSKLAALGVKSISIAGGPGAVSNGIEQQLRAEGYAVSRYGGATRYDTVALINRAYFPAGSTSTTFLATGLDFPDALAGAALAGRLAAPLNVTQPACVHPAVASGIDEVAAASRVVLGGTAIVSAVAASNTRCVYPVTNEPITDWSTTSWTLARDTPAPYADRPPVDIHDTTIKLDSTGLRIYLRHDAGTRADHPVAYAQYGISALLEYQRTGSKVWLDRAVRHGERLTQIHVERSGAWWFPYEFPWTYYERTIKAPWWSAMAQGQALSLFTRLAEVTGEARWNLAADATWSSFSQGYSSTAPWSTLVIDDHLYFEEYAGNQPPLLVLNGQIFAMFGLYDYWRHTGNAEAARYFDGGATTVLQRMMPLVQVPNGVSFYCVQADYCLNAGWQNQTYHVIHSWQLDTLATITNDTRFSDWANVLRDDWAPPSTFEARMFDSGIGPVFETGVEPGIDEQFGSIEP